MKVLVDTQSYYWGLCERASLSFKAREALSDPLLTKCLSVAVFWEFSIKSALGKLKLPREVPELWGEAEGDGFILLPILKQHLGRLATLPQHHRDPFDRLMIAQALEEGWSVVSSDEQWDAYGVHRIW
jgi:PIN domain nuclease of toxin-antitoxin system